MSTSCTQFWRAISALQADASLTESMSEQRLQRLNEQLTSARKEAEASGGMGCQGLAMANQRCPCSYIGDHRRLWEGQCFQSFFLAIRSLLGCALLTQGIQSLFIVVLAMMLEERCLQCCRYFRDPPQKQTQAVNEWAADAVFATMVIAKHGTYSTCAIPDAGPDHAETCRNQCGSTVVPRQVSRGRCRQLQVQLVWLTSLAGLETKKGPMVF